MLTLIKKNLAIASMQSAIASAHAKAGIQSFDDLDIRVRQLREAFDADPESVADLDVALAWLAIDNARLPSRRNLKRIWIQLRDDTGVHIYFPGDDETGSAAVWLKNASGTLQYSLDDRISWREDFPPETHTHPVSEIPDFPVKMPPEAHAHTVSEISDFPAEMPPEAHAHTVSEISNFPAKMPPETHAHTVSEISDFPQQMSPVHHYHAVDEVYGMNTGAVMNVHTLKGTGAPFTVIMALDGRTITAMRGWLTLSPSYPTYLGESVDAVPGIVRREKIDGTFRLTYAGEELSIVDNLVTFTGNLYCASGQKWTWMVYSE